jgi:hypothetical protein
VTEFNLHASGNAKEENGCGKNLCALEEVEGVYLLDTGMNMY